ncbi:MAG: glycosyltransferase [Devosia sp.]|nr:glycosyltransferase [Devosia sp.]
MVDQLVAAMRALDYPAEKLDIKFIVESRSPETLEAVRRHLGDPRFELVVVPEALPATKPKALNYALPLARGEHLVIYDAEDIPDPGQLRHAASRFAAQPEIDCLQAELVIDNAGENALTALFAGEYAGQFGLMLPLLARLKLPMPLGGTSNHFRVAALREVGGWDAFNVTEDADLGVRLSRLRYRTATMASRTREEAPVTLESWMRQRTRWVKGWMQTFLVHNRRPGRFLEDIGWRGFIAFQIYVGSLILSAPLHATFMLSVVAALLWPGAAPATFGPWELASLGVVLIGYGGAAALVVAGLLRIGRPELLGYQVLLPAYWLLHSVAAAQALHELLTRPYFWAKTAHGQTRLARRVVSQPE